MFKKYDVLTSDMGDVETRIKLLSPLDKKGRAIVKVLKAGLLDVDDGFVVKFFEVSNGLIKFSKVK